MSAKRRRLERPRPRRRLGEFGDAARIYEDILDDEAVDAPAIWLSLANAALAGGDRKRAAEAFLHLYYEFPLSEHAVQAEGPLQTLPEVQPIATGNARYKLEMGRGERLFGSTPLSGGAQQLSSAQAARDRATMMPSSSRCGSPRSSTSRAVTATRARRFGRS